MLGFLFCVLNEQGFTYNQIVIDTIKNDTIKVMSTEKMIPHFDLHIGAGTISGARLGLRAHFNEHFSFETSFGIPVTHFMGGGEREERYGIGLNLHQSSNSGLIISLICVAKVQPNISYPSIPNNKLLNYLMTTLNIGYLFISTSNLTFFLRGGTGFSFIEDFRFNRHKVNFGVYNLDFGLGWCFDFNKYLKSKN